MPQLPKKKKTATANMQQSFRYLIEGLNLKITTHPDQHLFDALKCVSAVIGFDHTTL